MADTIRGTQVVAEGVGENSAADIRATQVVAEGIGSNTASDVRGSQIVAEVLRASTANIGVTSIAAEVIRAYTAPPAPSSSISVPDHRVRRVYVPDLSSQRR